MLETLSLAGPAELSFVNAVADDVIIDADRDQIFRVLVNLGRNAQQALVARGNIEPQVDYVRIGARREGGCVTVVVEDTGPGVPARARDNLFQAFKGSARAGGTGLGLAIAWELVRAHGGDLCLRESERGAVFEFTIPGRGCDAGERRGGAGARRQRWSMQAPMPARAPERARAAPRRRRSPRRTRTGSACSNRGARSNPLLKCGAARDRQRPPRARSSAG